MIDSKLRHIAQPSFNKIALMMMRLKINANQATCGALFFGLLAGLALALSNYLLAFVFLWLSGFLDVIDGTIARLTATSTPQGAFLDLVFDRLVEGMVILGFFLSYPDNALSYILFLISVIFNFSTFMVAGVLIENESNKSMHYDVGIAERTETFLTFSLMILFPSFMSFFLLGFTGLVFLTGVKRMVKVIDSVRGRK